jgi:hypothetical protein
MLIIGSFGVNGVTGFSVSAHYSDSIEFSVRRCIARCKNKIKGMIKRGVAEYRDSYQYNVTLVDMISNTKFPEQNGSFSIN